MKWNEMKRNEMKWNEIWTVQFKGTYFASLTTLAMVSRSLACLSTLLATCETCCWARNINISLSSGPMDLHCEGLRHTATTSKPPLGPNQPPFMVMVSCQCEKHFSTCAQDLRYRSPRLLWCEHCIWTHASDRWHTNELPHRSISEFCTRTSVDGISTLRWRHAHRNCCEKCGLRSVGLF